MSMKFKVGDEVLVTAGRDKGKSGKIERVLPKENKVVVAGVNLFKRHQKSSGTTKPGGIIDIVKPLPVGNIAFTCPKCKLTSRISYTIKGKEKNRICKKCGQIV